MALPSSNVPEHCPGVESEKAGKSGPCQGCPNQTACASRPKGPDPDISLIGDKLRCIKNKIIVLSGKGGVGKTTFSAHIAHAFAHNEENQVAVLDIDICGPSIPRVMGLAGEQVHQSASGWSPVYVSENLSVMSIGFLLGSQDDAVIWRGPKKNGMIKQFLSSVDWSDLNYLIIDTPPGTSDEHISCVQYLSEADVTGAILVTTPQEVSLQDVRKEINFCRKVKLPILGVVENMSGYVCPNCKCESTVFVPTTGGAKQMCADMDVPYLGPVPLDPSIGKSCDDGTSFLEQFPDSPTTKAFLSIVQRITDMCR